MMKFDVLGTCGDNLLYSLICPPQMGKMETFESSVESSPVYYEQAYYERLEQHCLSNDVPAAKQVPTVLIEYRV